MGPGTCWLSGLLLHSMRGFAPLRKLLTSQRVSCCEGCADSRVTVLVPGGCPWDSSITLRRMSSPSQPRDPTSSGGLSDAEAERDRLHRVPSQRQSGAGDKPLLALGSTGSGCYEPRGSGQSLRRLPSLVPPPAKASCRSRPCLLLGCRGAGARRRCFSKRCLLRVRGWSVGGQRVPVSNMPPYTWRYLIQGTTSRGW